MSSIVPAICGLIFFGFFLTMLGTEQFRCDAGGAKTAVPLWLITTCLCLALAACASTTGPGGSRPEQATAPAVAPPPTLTPPPLDLAGKWRLSVTGSTTCTMTFGGSTGAADGSIAPAGGCPLNFFTSRKWSYESDKLVIRNHKGDVLAQLSFANGHFEGPAAS